MAQSRLDAEKIALAQHLPSKSYRFMDMDSGNPYILFSVETYTGNQYTLRVDLNGFPEKWPDMYVTKMLCDCKGEVLKEGSSYMDVLPSKYGYTHIDYLKYAGWVETKRDKDADSDIRIDSNSFPYTWVGIYLNKNFENRFFEEEVLQNGGWNVSLVDLYYLGQDWLEEYDYYIEHGITRKLDMLFD